MKFYFTLFLVLAGSLVFSQETLTPLLLIEKLSENNPQWQTGEYRLKKEFLEGQRKSLLYEPFLSLALSPAYSLYNNESQDQLGNRFSSLVQTSALNLSLGWRMPSQGTILLSASDTMTILKKDDMTFISQSPQLSLSFKQPVFVNGKFIEGRAYGAEKMITLTIPANRAELSHKKEINSLISTKLTEYYNLLILSESYQLKREETQLARRELEQLSSLKDKGFFSGTDFWKKQLEMEQAEDGLLELSYQLDSSWNSLSLSLGMGVDQLVLPILEIDRTMIPLPPREEIFSLIDKNGDLEELRLLWEIGKLSQEGGLSQKASELSFSLNVSPQYAPGNTGADSLGDSWSEFARPDSWIQTSLSVNLNFSPSDWAANKIMAEEDQLSAALSRMNWENFRRELEEQLHSLLEKDEMLQKKLDRIDESIEYQELLLEKERKLLALSSSTPLQVERARLNWTTRLLDKKRTLVEYSQNRLALLQLSGYDISTLDYRKLPGGRE